MALRRFLLCLAWVVLFSLQTEAQDAYLRNIPIDWFEEPEHHAPHWQVEFRPPSLIYSQRFVAGVSVTFPAKGQGHRPDWHLIYRVADKNGKWFRDYAHFRADLRVLPPDALPVSRREFVYLQPGAYRLVLVAYDAVNERHFVWRKAIRFERPGVLPEIDRALPAVEFANPERTRLPIPEYLPAHTQVPVQIDVVFNLTGNLQLSSRPDSFERLRQPIAEDALRGAMALLSQLAPSQGCVRVSAIDILRLKVALDRSNADPASNLRQALEAVPKTRDNATVDIHTLLGRTKAREFFHDFLDKVISDKTTCTSPLPNPKRAIIVVSDSLIFPEGTDREPVSPPESGSAQFFHIRFSYTRFAVAYKNPITGGQTNETLFSLTTFDEVGRMLGPLHPRHFNVVGPKDLRHAVAEIIKDIEISSTNAKR